MPEIANKEQLTGVPTESSDRHNNNKTLYDASYPEIFWKNFLAGFSRTLGGLVLYLIFIVTIGTVVLQFVMPLITPALNQLNTINGSLQKIPRF